MQWQYQRLAEPLEPSLTQAPPALSWFQPASEPVRPVPRANSDYRGYFARPLEPSLTQAPPPLSWWRPASEPTPRRRSADEWAGASVRPLEPSLTTAPPPLSWWQPAPDFARAKPPGPLPPCQPCGDPTTPLAVDIGAGAEPIPPWVQPPVPVRGPGRRPWLLPALAHPDAWPIPVTPVTGKNRPYLPRVPQPPKGNDLKQWQEYARRLARHTELAADFFNSMVDQGIIVQLGLRNWTLKAPGLASGFTGVLQ